MSDWTRYDRDEERRRFGAGGRARRNFDQDASYGEYDDYGDRLERERRSYAGEGDRPQPAYPQRDRHGGYAGEDFRPGPSAEPQRSAAQGYGQGYGPTWPRGSAAPAGRGYGREAYAPQSYGAGPQGQPGHGHEGVFGGDDWLERFSDGRTGVDFAGHHFQGHGGHRGRGPKNYTRSDDRIHEDVNDRLSDDSWLDASDIEVQVANGEVTLNGHVGSREDKRRAEDLAERVSGVRHVQNNLRIQQAASQAVAPPG